MSDHPYWPVVAAQAAFHGIIRQALTSAGLPSIFEPLGLDRSSDGMTLFPLRHGHTIWDATVAKNICDLWDAEVSPGIFNKEVCYLV